jgi:stage III sporulation protein AE
VGEVEAMRRALIAVFVAATVLAPVTYLVPAPRVSAASPGIRLAASPEAGDTSGTWESSLRNLDDSGVTNPIDRIFRDITSDGDLSWRQMVGDILTGKGIDFGRIGRLFTRNVAGGLLANSRVLGKIVLIGVAMACLEILTNTISPGGSSKIAMWASHLALIALAVLSFRDVLSIARSAMESLRAALFAFVPALTSLTVVSGMPVSAGVLHPLVFGMGSVVSIFVLDVAFPMIYTSIAVDMAGNLGGGERASGVASMLRQAAFFGLGVLMACFVGAVVGQKAAAGLADGMAYRTAKYMSSTFIPVAGKLVSDTMDMFFCSAYSLKSAIGLVGTVALFGALFSPLLEILSCLVVWKIAVAVLGPISGPSVNKSLKSMADGMALLAMSVFVTCFVFVICLAVVSRAVRPF